MIGRTVEQYANGGVAACLNWNMYKLMKGAVA
jgi:hypothetical protein